jgi:pimeloyl-ACP methyl ester carboxylesterase
MKNTTLRDGRRLAWHDWGSERGTPVVVCPGAGMAGPLPFGARAAEAMGLRCISVDRPGLGWSDPHPAKRFDSWTDDVRQLLLALGQVAVPVVGFSQGAPFALALAAAGLATRVAIVAGQDELAHPEVLAKLPEPVARFTRRALEEPRVLEAELAATTTEQWLWSMIESMSAPVDRAFYASADFAPQYRAALAAGFRQGAAGYARDTVLALSPWPFQLEEVRCPVALWYGLEDSSPVHSPDHGLILSERLPSATRHALAGAGSSILWTTAEAILEALRATS